MVLLHRQGFEVSTSTVGRILRYLKVRGMLKEPPRNGLKTRRKLKPHPYGVGKNPKGYQVREPGDLVELDTLDIRPLPGVSLKHFTAQNTVSHWDMIEVHSRANATTAADFPHEVLSRMPFPIKLVQVDRGSQFMADFEGACSSHSIQPFILPSLWMKSSSIANVSGSSGKERCFPISCALARGSATSLPHHEQKRWLLPSLAWQWGQENLRRFFRCGMVTIAWPMSISSALMARASEIRQPRRKSILISSRSRRLVAACSSFSTSWVSR